MAKCTKKEPGINILILWVRVFVSYVCTHLVLLFPSPLRCSNDGRGIGHTSLKKKIATMLAVIRQIRGTKAFGAMDNVYENALLIAEVAIGILENAGENSSNKIVR